MLSVLTVTDRHAIEASNVGAADAHDVSIETRERREARATTLAESLLGRHSPGAFGEGLSRCDVRSSRSTKLRLSRRGSNETADDGEFPCGA